MEENWQNLVSPSRLVCPNQICVLLLIILRGLLLRNPLAIFVSFIFKLHLLNDYFLGGISPKPPFSPPFLHSFLLFSNIPHPLHP